MCNNREHQHSRKTIMRIWTIIALLACIASASHAQYRKGNVELQLLGTAGSVSNSVTTTYNEAGIPASERSSSRMYLYVAATPAYYFADGFSGELELGLRALEGVPPAQSLIAHLSWTQRYRRSPIAWFVRAGYGRSNGLSIPLFDEYNRTTDGFDIGIISAGAGLKLRAGARGLVRIEANYRLQSYSTESPIAVFDHSTSTIALLFGFGVML
jgi:hypothetical protein